MLGRRSQSQQGSRQPGDKTSKYFHLSFNRHDAGNAVVLKKKTKLRRIQVRIGQIPKMQCKRTTGFMERNPLCGQSLTSFQNTISKRFHQHHTQPQACLPSKSLPMIWPHDWTTYCRTSLSKNVRLAAPCHSSSLTFPFFISLLFFGSRMLFALNETHVGTQTGSVCVCVCVCTHVLKSSANALTMKTAGGKGDEVEV